VTNRGGEAMTHARKGVSIFDEIVISQESQISPAFIFEVQIRSQDMGRLAEIWKRELPLAVTPKPEVIIEDPSQTSMSTTSVQDYPTPRMMGSLEVLLQRRSVIEYV